MRPQALSGRMKSVIRESKPSYYVLPSEAYPITTPVDTRYFILIATATGPRRSESSVPAWSFNRSGYRIPRNLRISLNLGVWPRILNSGQVLAVLRY
jgi:hypothetical protein